MEAYGLLCWKRSRVIRTAVTLAVFNSYGGLWCALLEGISCDMRCPFVPMVLSVWSDMHSGLVVLMEAFGRLSV
jgi:hypothetical protein